MAEIPPPDKGPLKRMNAGEMRASPGAAEDHFQYFLQAWCVNELYTASPYSQPILQCNDNSCKNVMCVPASVRS